MKIQLLPVFPRLLHNYLEEGEAIISSDFALQLKSH